MRLLPPPCPDCLAEPPGELAEVDVPAGLAWYHYCDSGVWRRSSRGQPSGHLPALPPGQHYELFSPLLELGGRCRYCGGTTHGTSHPASGPAQCPGNPARGLYPADERMTSSSPASGSWAPAAAAYGFLALALFVLVAGAVLLATLG